MELEHHLFFCLYLLSTMRAMRDTGSKAREEDISRVRGGREEGCLVI